MVDFPCASHYNYVSWINAAQVCAVYSCGILYKLETTQIENKLHTANIDFTKRIDFKIN